MMSGPKLIPLNEMRATLCATPVPAVLCGAGVSMIPPTDLPSGNQLRDICIRSLLSDDASSELVEDILSSRAYQNLLPESVIQDIALYCSSHIDKLMARVLGDSEPNLIHRAISHTFDTVYTTNFDLCLEIAGATRVFHLHGSILRQDSMQNRVFRLGKTCTDEFSHLEAAIRNKRLFIVGYSLRDQDVTECLSRAKPSELLFLSYDGNLPEFLFDVPSDVSYSVGGATAFFGLEETVSRSSNMRSRLAKIRMPCVTDRCAALLNLCWRAGLYGKGKEVLTRYLPKLKGRRKYKAICNAADDLRMVGDYAASLNLCDKLIQSPFVNRPSNLDILSWVHVLYGLNYLDQGLDNYDLIEEHFRKALEATDMFISSAQNSQEELAGMEVWRAKIYNNLGLLQVSKGDYQEALYHYRRSCVIKQKHHDDRGLARPSQFEGCISR